LIAAAVAEWQRFEFGLGQEHKRPYVDGDENPRVVGG
jgi:hypothetical protein